MKSRLFQGRVVAEDIRVFEYGYRLGFDMLLGRGCIQQVLAVGEDERNDGLYELIPELHRYYRRENCSDDEFRWIFLKHLVCLGRILGEGFRCLRLRLCLFSFGRCTSVARGRLLQVRILRALSLGVNGGFLAAGVSCRISDQDGNCYPQKEVVELDWYGVDLYRGDIQDRYHLLVLHESRYPEAFLVRKRGHHHHHHLLLVLLLVLLPMVVVVVVVVHPLQAQAQAP
jgi:hypothetical protein